MNIHAWYRGRPALVIGGLGFIGSNLSRRLLDLDATVTIVTPEQNRYPETVAELSDRGAAIVDGDLRDMRAMTAAVAGQAVIFNLSGRSGAALSMADPWTDLDVNCRGNLVLLEAVRQENPGAKLVFPGSRLEYGPTAMLPVGEDLAMDPICIHAVHKIAVEQYLRLYQRVYGIRSTVARITNPYGPGQPSSREAYGIINRLIHLAMTNQSLPIYGDGTQLRDYIFIDDAVDALLRMGADPASDGRAYNVGSGTGTRFVDMARAVMAAAGGGRLEFVPWPRLAEQIETGDFVADVGRIRGELGWQPVVSLDEGIRRTVEFYRPYVGVGRAGE